METDMHSIWTRHRKAPAVALFGIPTDYRDAKNAPVNFRAKMHKIIPKFTQALYSIICCKID